MPKATAKTKIINILPSSLRKGMNKPKLKQLTFGDLATVNKALKKYHAKNPSELAKKVPNCKNCTWCVPWN